MRILVYMRDGRTVYAIKGRGNLARLVNVEPWHEQPGVLVERGIWNPITGEYVWQRIFVRFLSKGSIACVEQHPVQGDDVAEAA